VPTWRTVIGAMDRGSARAWSSPGKVDVLIIAPHPDDETFGSAGAILEHVRVGDAVTVAIATDGRRSRAVADPDEMARVRLQEAHQALGVLGVHRLEWLGLAEGDWSTATLVDRLRRLLAELEPHIVYAPSRVDFHPEHMAVAHALAVALESAPDTARSSLIRIYQVQVPLTSLLANVVLDTSASRSNWSAALCAYASQAGTLDTAYRQRAYTARANGRGCSAEAFWEMDVAAYVRMHRDPPARWPRVFRGLRSWPFTDPLAFIAGNDERKRLRAAWLAGR
jgi:LmbE family N-acetylglucosaminyl deacetylase